MTVSEVAFRYPSEQRDEAAAPWLAFRGSKPIRRVVFLLEVPGQSRHFDSRGPGSQSYVLLANEPNILHHAPDQLNRTYVDNFLKYLFHAES